MHLKVMKSGTKVTTAGDGVIRTRGVRSTFAAGLSEKSCLPFGRVEKLRLCHRRTAPVHNSWLGRSRISAGLPARVHAV